MLERDRSMNRVAALRSQIVGIDREVPLLDGSTRPYIYLDNAASTPALAEVKKAVDGLLEWYSSVHRGSGFKSLVSSRAYDRAHQVIATFVGADPELDCVIFGKNTTEAINTLAGVFAWQTGDVVVTTLLEHHSDDLPWRGHTHVEHAGVDAVGALDVDDVQRKLDENKGHVRLVAVTGASNVTGFMPPVYEIAAMAHRAGALILVDCAQLAPHRAIDMRPHEDEQHLDFVCLSGHKMYAPYGGGALVGPRAFFEQNPPFSRGGGTIEMVTLDDVHWAEAPERDEAGSPNVLGAVAMAAAAQALMAVGMQAIADHERELTGYLLTRLAPIRKVHVYGSADPQRLDDRLGVISFDVEDVPHSLVAAILGFEAGIGVRNGCFCAHPYILHLLGVTGQVYESYQEEVLDHDRRRIPGMVRASFGCYNNRAEVDSFVDWIERISVGDYKGDYVQERASGSWFPLDYDPARLDDYYSL
jgi:cysteine desulfurase / selenocysteine lyase